MENSAESCGVFKYPEASSITVALAKSEHLVVDDNRSGVMLVHNSERLVAVWAQCYRIDRSLQPDEREVRLRVRIHRGQRGVPVLLTKRGRRSTFLSGKTLRRFEEENGVVCKPLPLADLSSKADGMFGRRWTELNAKERLQVLEWIAEG